MWYVVNIYKINNFRFIDNFFVFYRTRRPRERMHTSIFVRFIPNDIEYEPIGNCEGTSYVWTKRNEFAIIRQHLPAMIDSTIGLVFCVVLWNIENTECLGSIVSCISRFLVFIQSFEQSSPGSVSNKSQKLRLQISTHFVYFI